MLAREGPKGVTVRKVSAEAGWSRDAVDHYFEGKQELVVFAVELAVDRALSQVRACCDRLEGRAALRSVLLEALALERSRPAPSEAWLELLSLSARDSELAAKLACFNREVSAQFASVIAGMVQRGNAAPGRDPTAEAANLFAFNLGFALAHCREAN